MVVVHIFIAVVNVIIIIKHISRWVRFNITVLFIKFDYTKKKFFKIINKQKLDLIKCKYILIRQDPPFNLEYISATYILDSIKNKVRIINNPTSIRNISEKLYLVFKWQ